MSSDPLAYANLAAGAMMGVTIMAVQRFVAPSVPMLDLGALAEFPLILVPMAAVTLLEVIIDWVPGATLALEKVMGAGLPPETVAGGLGGMAAYGLSVIQSGAAIDGMQFAQGMLMWGGVTAAVGAASGILGRSFLPNAWKRTGDYAIQA